MGEKARHAVSSILAGFMILLAVLGAARFIEGRLIFLHLWSFAILVVLWLIYSVMFWGFFEQRMPFFTARFFRSMGVGLGTVFFLTGLMSIAGKFGLYYFSESASPLAYNTAGLGMLWIFCSGVAFGPRKKKVEAE